MMLKTSSRLMVFLGAVVMAASVAAGPAVKSEDGKYLDKEGNPIYNVKDDGTWDWYTASGYRRYHSECHVCHGPDAEGSTYAPALKDSLKTMTYDQFVDTVVNGRVNVTATQKNVMPSFGTNRNVMCYLDDIYVYIKARSDGALPRERPEKRETKSDVYKKNEDQCIGG
jgi:methanol metabolism-related c-type cytochrome